MSKYTPSLIQSGSNSTEAINQELQKIADAISDQLDKTAPAGNSMQGNLDMDSNYILNLKDAARDSDAANLRTVKNFLGSAREVIRRSETRIELRGDELLDKILTTSDTPVEFILPCSPVCGDDIPVGFEFEVVQCGLGQVCFIAETGCTLKSKDDDTAICGKGGAVTVTKISDTEWLLVGALVQKITLPLTGTLNGTLIVNTDNTPVQADTAVESQVITLVDLDGSRTTNTDTDGNFSFSDVPAGAFTLDYDAVALQSALNLEYGNGGADLVPGNPDDPAVSDTISAGEVKTSDIVLAAQAN